MVTTPFRGIHEILRGPPGPQQCIDLLISYFGADATLDPGPSHPLAIRLTAIAASINQLGADEMFHRPLVFVAGTEHEVRGKAVRFFLGESGANLRYAYVVDQPETCVRYVRAHGGWSDDSETQTVTELVGARLLDELRLVAPSQAWARPPTEPQAESATPWQRVAAQLTTAQLDELVHRHAATSLTQVGQRLYVGPDVMVMVAAGCLYLSGADDDAVDALGFQNVEGWTIDRHTSSAPTPPPEPPPPLQAGMVTAPSELPTRPTLDDLDRVPWDRLEDAYGIATSIPECIRNFHSLDAATHDAALYGLYGNIFHQGTRYSVTPYAVPFIALGLHGDLARQTTTLEYLLSLAVGYEESHFPDTFDIEGRRQAVADMAEDRRWNLAAEIDTNEAVARLWPDIVALLRDSGDRAENLAVVDRAAHLLAYLPDRAGDSFEALARAVSDGRPRPSMWVAMGVLGRHLGRSPNEIAQSTTADTADTTCAKLIARCLLGDQQAAASLLGHLAHTHESLDIWLEGNQTSMIVASLSTLVGWPNHEQATAVFGTLEALHPFAQSNVLTGLYRAIFAAGGLPPQASGLSELQRDSLERGLELVDQAPPPRLLNLESSLPLKPLALRRYLDGDYDLSV